jgi:hypothetical protein
MSEFDLKDKLLRDLSAAAQALEDVDQEGDPLELTALVFEPGSRRQAVLHFQECIGECRSAGITEEEIRHATGTATEATHADEDD